MYDIKTLEQMKQFIGTCLKEVAVDVVEFGLTVAAMIGMGLLVNYIVEDTALAFIITVAGLIGILYLVTKVRLVYNKMRINGSFR